MKKLVILLLLVVLLLTSSCQYITGEALEPAPTTTPAPAPMPTPAPGPSRMVRFERIDPVISPFGEKVELTLSFVNEASEPRIMSPFPPEINIQKANTEPLENVRSFPAGSQESQLEPGEAATYDLVWDQKDDNGQQAAPGWYGVEVTAASREISETAGGHVRGWATKILIQYPQGALEKTIEVNQSQTVDGITVTLQRIELTPTGMTVYAFNTPPEYGLPQGPMLPPPPLMSLHAAAEYSIDGGAVKQAGLSGIRFLEGGMLHTWDNLDPVPADAEELTFTITRLGDREGPWEFKVPLE